MKKIIISLFIVLAIITGVIIYIVSSKEKPCSNCEKNAKTEKVKNDRFADYFKNETNLCNILTKQTVSELLGKAIIRANPIASNNIHSCQYYLENNQAVIVNYDTLNVEKQKKGHEFLDRKIITNPKISTDHFLVIQENGLINEIYLVLGKNEYVSINRTSGKTVSEDEIVSFAANLSQIVSGIVPLSTPRLKEVAEDRTVPLPQEKDIITNFFVLIDEKKASDAVNMMDDNITSNDSLKQAWAVQLNAINSMKVVKIEPSMTENWSGEKHQYKLTLDVVMDPNSANALIPYYGWDNGKNTRWATIVKKNGSWKIQELATGP